MAGASNFRLRIITPDRVFYDEAVEMVEFCTTEGEIGVLPEHIPMTVIVKPGILAIHERDKVKEAALHAGFAEIMPKQVTILAEVIEWPEEIDKKRAEAAKERAEERLRIQAPGTDIVRAEVALLRAITRIHVLR